MRNENDPTTKLLSKFNINYDLVKEQFKILLTNDSEYLEISDSSFPEEKDDSEGGEKQNPFIPKSESSKSRKSKTPVLDNFGKDITRLAEMDKLDQLLRPKRKLREFLKF